MNPFYCLLLFCSLSLTAQNLDKDYLMVTVLFDEQFNSVDSTAQHKISQYLKSRKLEDLVQSNILSRVDMAGFTLPLGVFKNEAPLNFQKGMVDMWQSKLQVMQKQPSLNDIQIMKTALSAWESMIGPQKTMSLSEYKNRVLAAAKDSLNELHLEMQKLYSSERKVFMDMIFENLTENLLLGYNIQELLPTTHMTVDRQIKDINPLFKAYYLDRVLQEGGTNFIAYFPARYDAANSFGPFQFTNIALKDIQQNSRLVKGFKIFKSMEDLKKIEDHALAAALFAYNNWERLSYLLQQDGTLSKINEYCADYSLNEEKKQQLQIMVAGVTACMHHQPPQSFSFVRKYLNDTEILDKMYFEVVADAGKQLRKYYRSAAEAFLIAKVYNQLFGE